MGHVTTKSLVVTKPVVSQPAPAVPADRRSHSRSDRLQIRHRRIVFALVFLVLAVAVSVSIINRPTPVTLVVPEERVITESIAASGLVGGYREVVVGAQTSGTVESIRVVEGERVRRGHILALMDNAVVNEQVFQARQAQATARAQLAQQSAGSLASEIDAAVEHVRQARIVAGERRSQVIRAQEATVQADLAVTQARAQLDRARRDVESAQARLDLKSKTLERAQALYNQGAVARQEVDQATADHAVGVNDLASARSQCAYAESALQSAQAARRVALQDVKIADAEARGAERALAATGADLTTLRAQPRREVVAVARQRVLDAGAAVRVQQAQASNTAVRAPFDGIVTKIVAEPGAFVTAAGVVRLIESDRPEIRVNVDESNLANLLPGRPAIITSAAYSGKQADGDIIRVGAQVDSDSGTVEVAVRYDPTLSWLRPGQTVDVNLIVKPAVKRLLIPLSAVRRGASGNVVMIVRNSRAASLPVTLGAPVGTQAPVLAGVSPGQKIILNAEQVTPGSRIKVVGRR